MKIVGFVGPKRSGKDTAAAALVEQRGFVRIGFADAVKDLALRINPIIDYQTAEDLNALVSSFGWEQTKDYYPEVRRILQELGTGVRDIVGAESWIDAWFDQFVSYRGPGIVVPDVRFTNEAGAIRQVRADWESGCSAKFVEPTLLIRITRPGLDSTDTHVSETEQASIGTDVEVINDGTTEELKAKVLAVYDEWCR